MKKTRSTHKKDYKFILCVYNTKRDATLLDYAQQGAC